MLKDKKGTKIIDAFKKFQKSEGQKPNKIWVKKSGELYNSSMKS